MEPANLGSQTGCSVQPAASVFEWHEEQGSVMQVRMVAAGLASMASVDDDEDASLRPERAVRPAGN